MPTSRGPSCYGRSCANNRRRFYAFSPAFHFGKWFHYFSQLSLLEAASSLCFSRCDIPDSGRQQTDGFQPAAYRALLRGPGWAGLILLVTAESPARGDTAEPCLSVAGEFCILRWCLTSLQEPQAERMQRFPRCFAWPDPRFWAAAARRFSSCCALVRGPSGGGVLIMPARGDAIQRAGGFSGHHVSGWLS